MKVTNQAGLAFFISSILLSLLWVWKDWPVFMSTGFIGFITGGFAFYIACALVHFGTRTPQPPKSL